MSVFQAAFIALFYAFARSAFNAGLGAYILSQPLVTGTIAGLLLGDPLAGAALGGVLNLSTLVLSNLRVRVGPDVALIGYVGVSIMLLGGVKADTPAAATLFAALAVLGILINFMRGVVNSVLAHWADYFAERGDAAIVGFINVGPTQVWLFLITFLPAFLLLRMDTRTLLDITATIPYWVQSALNLSQYLLAALGIALSLRLLMQGSAIAYFLLGWLGAQVFGLVPVTLFGASVALIHAFLARKRMESSQDTLISDLLPANPVSAAPTATAQRLTVNDLRTSVLLWVFFHDAGLNYERGQNMGFAAAMAPVASRLYSDLLERAACLRRHLTLFSTEFSLGALLLGATAAMEERRAAGDAISDAEFVGAKSGLMASLGVMGDTLVLGGITAFGVAVGAALARQQSLLGPFLFVVFEATVVLTLAFSSFRLGYNSFRRLEAWARANDWLRAGLFGAVRLGAFMLGALIISLAPVHLPAAASIQIDAARISLQGLLDGIMPRMVPLAITLALWWLLRHKRMNPMVLLGAIILLSVIACGILRLLGWL
jgi:PTS system mannose-specific IID component